MNPNEIAENLLSLVPEEILKAVEAQHDKVLPPGLEFRITFESGEWSTIRLNVGKRDYDASWILTRPMKGAPKWSLQQVNAHW